MKLRHKIGLGIWLLDGIMGIALGLVYCFSGKMMPYHAQIIGKNWAELDGGIKVVILMLMQLYGVALIAWMLMCLVVLFIPFRQGERWANWTLFLANIVVYITTSFFINFKIYLATNASTAWPLALAAMVLGLLAFLLSLGMEKDKK